MSFMSGLRHEIRELIPPFVYFFIAFHVIAVTRALMLEEYDVHVTTVAAATISALVVAKAILLTDLLPAVNRFPDRPLIWNVAWKTLLYSAGALFLHYLEHLIKFWRETGSFAAANQKLFSEVVWSHFWAVQIWLVTLLFVYCALRELVRHLGRDQVRELFFGARSAGAG